MDIVLHSVEDKKRSNVYVFEMKINYASVFNKTFKVEVHPTQFEQMFLEFISFALSRQLSLFQIAQHEGTLGSNFTWLKDIDVTFALDACIDNYNIYYYNELHEKFTVQVPQHEALLDDIFDAYEKHDHEGDDPSLAIMFIQKHLLESQIKEAKPTNKIKI